MENKGKFKGGGDRERIGKRIGRRRRAERGWRKGGRQKKEYERST